MPKERNRGGAHRFTLIFVLFCLSLFFSLLSNRGEKKKSKDDKSWFIVISGRVYFVDDHVERTMA